MRLAARSSGSVSYANVEAESHNARLQAFEDEGYVRFPRFFPAEVARVLLELVWEDYSQRYGVSYDDPAGWSTKKGKEVRLYGPPAPEVRESLAYKAVVDKLHEAADSMLGQGVWRSRGRTTLFVNCPNPAGDWTLPSGWHTDVDGFPADAMPNFIYVFAFLDLLERHGGSTVLLAGSSRRARAMEAPVPQGGQSFVESLAKEDPRFEALFAVAEGAGPLEQNSDEFEKCLVTEGVRSSGVLLKMVELTGGPGDLVFWDPRGLHSASANARDRPRTVIRFRLERVGIRGLATPRVEDMSEARALKGPIGGACWNQLDEDRRRAIRETWHKFDSTFALVRNPKEVGHIARMLDVKLTTSEFRSMITDVEGHARQMVRFEHFAEAMASGMLTSRV